MKRKETLEIEKALEQLAKEKRWYGCEEITIGFYNAGKGNEVCDYVLMDSKGTLRCYEIKVTLSDLRSNAKKSWYGHYNYLVVTKDLYEKMKESDFESLPKHVGVIVSKEPLIRDIADDKLKELGFFFEEDKEKKHDMIWSLETVKKPIKQNITTEQQLMLTQSMTRSMMYKVRKYKDSHSLEYIKELKSEVEKQKRMYKECFNEKVEYLSIIRRFERWLRREFGYRIKLYDLADILKDDND